jgi:putative hemolysin
MLVPRSFPATPATPEKKVISRTFAAGGKVEVRISRDPADIAAAQALRYSVFYQEMTAIPSAAMAAARRDFDRFDDVCDHLLVIDHRRAASEAVVGTYRLLRQHIAESYDGFYSAGEYDLSVLTNNLGGSGTLLEVGRSCVHPEYRNQVTIQRLWRGIASYVVEHDVRYIFGCGSLPGTDPSALAAPLSYLYHEFLAPPELRVRALPERYVSMNVMPPEAISSGDVFPSLPPLIKGYLRLGGYVGDGAVVDEQFSTTDVFIMVPIERVADRYFSHVSNGKPGAA